MDEAIKYIEELLKLGQMRYAAIEEAAKQFEIEPHDLQRAYENYLKRKRDEDDGE